MYLYSGFMHLLFLRLADEKCRHLFVGHSLFLPSVLLMLMMHTHTHTHMRARVHARVQRAGFSYRLEAYLGA